MPVPKRRQHGEQTGGIKISHAAAELGLPVGLHTSSCGVTLSMGVLQEMDTNFSERISWESEGQGQHSMQRGGSSACLWTGQAGP